VEQKGGLRGLCPRVEEKGGLRGLTPVGNKILLAFFKSDLVPWFQRLIS
jgi:hypothetical protein